MGEHPAVSVIVPVYNVETYVGECVESVRGQSFRDLEILLLDDGSTDGSAAVCERHAAQDDRIRFFHHDNRGPGPTRNRGIRLARGRYLAFVDSDDLIEPDFLRDLYQRAVETGADITVGEAVSVWDDGQSEEPWPSAPAGTEIVTSEETIGAFFRERFFGASYRPSACDKLYEKGFVDRWGLEFSEDLIGEDLWFQLQALIRYPHIAFSSGGRYRYRQRAGSIMHSPKKDHLARERRMLMDYDRLIRTVPGGYPIGETVCAVLAGRTLTTMALERIRFGRDRRAFFRDMETLRSDPFLMERILRLADPKVRGLEPERGRRILLGMIGHLYRMGTPRLADRIVWAWYSMRLRR